MRTHVTQPLVGDHLHLLENQRIFIKNGHQGDETDLIKQKTPQANCLFSCPTR